MRRSFWIPIAMFVAGLGLIVTDVATGEADLSLFIIFPVFSGTTAIFLLGTSLIVSSFILGFVLIAWDSGALDERARAETSRTSDGSQGRSVQYGGVVLLGPIPIAFGSNKKIALVMLVVGIVMAIVILGLLLA